MSVTRYDMDFDDDVLYCYEIQLEESCRGKGLGKFMMKVLRQREKRQDKVNNADSAFIF